MIGTAAAMLGGSLIGGLISSDSARSAGNKQADAAKQASDTQLQASREANALQSSMYRQNLATQAPGLQAGQTGLAALMQGLGLGQLQATQGAPGSVDQYGNPIAGVQNYGATQAQLNQGAGSIQSGQLNRGLPSDFTQDPSYQFRLTQGMKKLEAGAAARGGLLTGQSGVDQTNYAQGAASQEYQSAFDRNRATQTDMYNRLSSLAGLAPQVASNLGSAGQQYANQAGGNITNAANMGSNYLTQGASAQAQAGIAGGNAWTGGINNALGSWAFLQGKGQNPLAANQWFGNGSGSGPSNADLQQMYYPG